ncbi:ABC transporter substrate-binding protein [Microbacterium invictum]|uniref:Peptide/nickel transport system substrate-binding protein n=1 Tax=Microbacterium invictum TaxID=515415 RepID=A0AA40SSC9_9MICO|nr:MULTISPECIES: ABC transporter substrate-binding protein [Microbacterium]MBB4141342.1 peptide/nickel transport system substrate-binding protein [Microbacterium invictum]
MNRIPTHRRAGRIAAAVAGTVAAAVVLAGCGGAASPAPSDGSPADIDPAGTIEAGISYALSGSFDPMIASGAVTVAANWHIFEGLVDLDPVTKEPYAALAADLPTQVDETTYDIDIREGATFHNGDPVTAEDVVYSYERVLDPASESLFTTYINFIDTVTAVDEDTVEITTKFPYSLLNDRLGIVKIVPKAVVEADAEDFGAHPVGSGPYALVSAVPEDKVVFEAYEDYNGPRPAKAAGMNWNLLADSAARVTAMSSGTIQAMEDVPYIDVDTLASTVDVDSVQSFGLLFMMFNTDAAPFDDVRVRQAFFYALDMDKIIETGMLGNATAASSFLPESYPNYNEASTVYTYDPDKAESLLSDAGVSDLSITLLTTDTGWVKEVAPLIKESLDAIGVDVTLEVSQSAAAYAKVDSGDYTVMVAPGDPSVFGSDPDLLMNWWYGDNVWTNTRTNWSDTDEYAQLRTLLDAAVQEEGDAQQQTWNQAFDLIADEAVLYPLFHRKLPTAWNDQALVDFAPVPTTGLSFLDVGVAAG